MDFGPFRSIKGDTVLSPSLPRLGIRISPDFVYLGKLHYISADNNHVEQFIFISPNGLGHVTRVLLVQFTGFLGNKAGVYQLPGDKSLQLAGDTYQYEVQSITIEEYIRRFPAQELAHAADYVRQRSYTLAGEMHCINFMRLVSADQRNLFEITYLESIEETAAAAGDLTGVEEQFFDHTASSFTLVSYDSVASDQ